MIRTCVDCGKVISYGHKRCINCNKKYHVGKNASNWKNVKYNCTDCGKKLANMYAKRCQSCSSKGKLNSHFGKLPHHSKRIYYKNFTFRSYWESNFAQFLDLNAIKWEYEQTTFDLGDKTYTPDFYLPEFDLWIEIKGYWRKDAKAKFRKFKKIYPDNKIKVLNKKILNAFGVI